MNSVPPGTGSQDLMFSASSLRSRDRAAIQDIITSNASALSPAWTICDNDGALDGALVPAPSGSAPGTGTVRLHHSNGATTIFEVNWLLPEALLLPTLNRIGAFRDDYLHTQDTKRRDGSWISGFLGGRLLSGKSGNKKTLEIRSLFDPNNGKNRKKQPEQRMDILLAGASGSGKTTAITVTTAVPVAFTRVPATDVMHTPDVAVAIDHGYCDFSGIALHLYSMPDQAGLTRMIGGALSMCDAALILADASRPDPIDDVYRQATLLAELGMTERPLLVAYTHLDVCGMPKNFSQQITARLGFRIPSIPLDPRNRGSVIRALSVLASGYGASHASDNPAPLVAEQIQTKLG